MTTAYYLNQMLHPFQSSLAFNQMKKENHKYVKSTPKIYLWIVENLKFKITVHATMEQTCPTTPPTESGGEARAIISRPFVPLFHYTVMHSVSTLFGWMFQCYNSTHWPSVWVSNRERDVAMANMANQASAILYVTHFEYHKCLTAARQATHSIYMRRWYHHFSVFPYLI